MENHRTKLIEQVGQSFNQIRKAPKFITKHKLWSGYWNNGAISKISIIVAFVCSIKLFIEFKNMIFNPSTNPEIMQSSMVSMDALSKVGNDILFTGGMKYLMLIVLEMLIFHFSVKTYEVLSGEKQNLKVKDFIHAQIRMIKVAIRSWIYEIIITALIAVGFEILGFESFTKVFSFFVQCYFIGIAFMDNYNEQFDLTIKESFKLSLNHLGAVLTIGLIAYLLLLIPVVGAIFAPFICAVAATTYMYYNEGKLVSGELV